MRSIVLCSTSRYRGELLARLRLPFVTARPEVNETPQSGEPADALSQRLATAKARALAADFPDALLIGSDQVASRDGLCIGKPENRDAAIAQLLTSSGREVRFHTAVAIFDTNSGQMRQSRDITTVRFRNLQRREIERYLDQEPALDCAGSFKCEGLGITLLDAIETQDPTALIGLPLIATARLLREFGVNALA